MQFSANSEFKESHLPGLKKDKESKSSDNRPLTSGQENKIE